MDHSPLLKLLNPQVLPYFKPDAGQEPIEVFLASLCNPEIPSSVRLPIDGILPVGEREQRCEWDRDVRGDEFKPTTAVLAQAGNESSRPINVFGTPERDDERLPFGVPRS